jgi:flagellar basal body-associated protein FliL
MTKPHKYMNHHLSKEEGAAKSIAIIAIVAALVVVIGALSFSPLRTVSAERDFSKCVFGEQGTNNCQKQQSKAFNKCIEKASEDGELTENEYFACAYSIYA